MISYEGYSIYEREKHMELKKSFCQTSIFLKYRLCKTKKMPLNFIIFYNIAQENSLVTYDFGPYDLVVEPVNV